MNIEKFIEKNNKDIIKVSWNSTINKYNENIILSKKILTELKEEDFFEPMIDFIEKTNISIDKYVEDVENPSYQIAVVGAIKAGKSTLINALLGTELASVNVTPETATLTKFRYSKKNLLKIKFYSENEWEKIWKDANDKNAEVFLEEYKKLGAESVKNNYLDKETLTFNYETLDEMKVDIEKWTSSKHKEHYFVKEISIGLSSLNLPEQICLVDTPGLNDVVDYRSKLTRDYIESANSVLICVNAKTLRNEEFLTIAKVFSGARYKKDMIYILGTQVDTMNSLEDWEKQRKEWIKYLKAKEFFESEDKAEKQLIEISSFAYNLSNKINNEIEMQEIMDLSKTNFFTPDELKNLYSNNKDIELITKVNEKLKEKSNIDLVKDVINTKLLNNYNEKLLTDFIEKYRNLKDSLNQFSEKHTEILENKLKELEMTTTELDKIVKEEKEKIANIEKINTKLIEKISETNKNFNLDLDKLNSEFSKLEKNIREIDID